MPPLFASIAGTPSCGKTYFLASMTWRLRHSLPRSFAMTFADADPVSNLLLNEYENQQFFSPTPDVIVKLAKTQEHGDLYDTVMYGDQLVEYPKPFLFTIRPSANHPNHAQSARVILPGEMKDLMNKVTEAKKAAEANLIVRREETAAMRSQANTAKVLADNPTLMRLRELEVLEKVASSGKLSVVLGEKGLADRVVNLL